MMMKHKNEEILKTLITSTNYHSSPNDFLKKLLQRIESLVLLRLLNNLPESELNLLNSDLSENTDIEVISDKIKSNYSEEEFRQEYSRVYSEVIGNLTDDIYANATEEQKTQISSHLSEIE